MKFLKSAALILGLLLVAYFAGATVYNIVYDSNRDGTAEFSVDVDGNTVNVGTFATATAAVTGPVNIIATPYGVGISSSSSSTTIVKIGGAYETLPTSGYSEGAIVYDKTNKMFYYASAAVTGTGSWSQL